MTIRYREFVGQDVTFALRQLLRAPAFSIVVILMLALGIGATTAMFTLLDAVILRPLPFKEPNRVVNLHPVRDGVLVSVASNLEFATWRSLPVFDAVAAQSTQNSFVLTRGSARPEVVSGTRVTWQIGTVLGVTPERGRTFTAAEDSPGAAHVMVLSHRYWVREFQGAASAIGSRVSLDGESYVVVGVMPESLDSVFGLDDFWVPLALSSAQLEEFHARALQIVARVARHTSIASASAAVNAEELRLAREQPMWGTGFTAQVRPYADDLVGNLRSHLAVLFAAVVFVFVIACANVTGLLLARSGVRAREMVVRTALGASRSRLTAQLLVEAGILSAIGGLLGIALAAGAVRALTVLAPTSIPRIAEASGDGRALLFVIAIISATTLLIGTLPAMRATTPDLTRVLREGGRGIGASHQRGAARSVLVGIEVALAIALLSGAGLLMRSFWALVHQDPGFDASRATSAQVVLPAARFGDLRSASLAFHRIRDRVAAVPGVDAAALTSALPLTPTVRAGIGAQGQPLTDGERFIAPMRIVTPRFFAAAGIRVRAGRDFTDADDANAPLVVIVNEALARRFWPNRPAIGQRMEGMDASHQHFMEVVGVAADSRDVALDQSASPEFYIPLDQTPVALWPGLQNSLFVVARTKSDPAAMGAPIAKAIEDVDPSLPVPQVATLAAVQADSRAAAEFNTTLLCGFAGMALLLSCLGIYGLISHFVGQRTSEIGLRIAIGATGSNIAGWIVKKTLIPVAVGAIAGFPLALATSTALRDQLFDVTPTDPLTLCAVAGVILAISALSMIGPLLRAASTSPIRAIND